MRVATPVPENVRDKPLYREMAGREVWPSTALSAYLVALQPGRLLNICASLDG